MRGGSEGDAATATTRRRLLAFLLAGGTLLIAGCADDGSGGAGGSASAPGDRARRAAPSTDTSPPSAPSAVVLPGLFSIMVGLEADMARVSRGLWLENFDTVAAGAEGVANHPRVPPEEFQRISDVLQEEMTRFAAVDREVHDLAVRLAEQARRGDLQAVLSTDAELRRACVACHTRYRERLREEIR